MKTIIRLTPIVLLLLAGSVYGYAIHAHGNYAQEKNPFVGVWEPVPDQGVTVFIKSLWINEDGTWAAEMTGGRKDMKGLHNQGR